MKVQEHFVCGKKTKITSRNNFLMRVHDDGSVSDTTMMHVCGATDTGASILMENTHAAFCLQAEESTCLWYCPEQTSKTDRRRNWFNKVIIFVFFAHKKYSSSFIKLGLNH